MGRLHRWLGPLALGLLLLAPGPAPALAAEREALVAQILELSGWKEQIAQVPDSVEANLQALSLDETLEPEVRDLFMAFVTRAFRPEAITKETTAAILAQNATEEQMRRAIEMMKTPLSQKFTRLEVEAGTKEGMAGRLAYLATLDENPPPSQRIDLVKKLDVVSRASNFGVEMAVTLMRGLIAAAQGTLAPASRTDPRQVESFLMSYRKEMTTQVHNYTLLTFLYTYRSVTDEELTQYIDLLSSEDGQWLVSTMGDAVLTALARTADAVAEELRKQLKI